MLQLVGLYFAILSFSIFFVFPIDNAKNVLGVSSNEEIVSPIADKFEEDQVEVKVAPSILPVTPSIISSISAAPVKKIVLSTTPVSEKITPTPQVSVTTSVISVSKQDYLMQKINEYRKSQGLSGVSMDNQTCSFAKVRAEEISNNFSHEGFRQRIDSKTLPYPDYKNVTENIAMNSDHTKVVDMWIDSPGHAENMRKDTPYVCVGIYQNYFAYEGFRP